MSRTGHPRRSIVARLALLFALLLIAFTMLVTLLNNALIRREQIEHYGETMQRDAYSISQNLYDMIANNNHGEVLDETRFSVDREMLGPYLSMTEQITRCNVYVIDNRHNVTGYFDGVVQTLASPVLPAYIEQSIALGFMGKTPFITSRFDGETHLTACMPVMNAYGRALGVVMLESTLRELGYTQISSFTVLSVSLAISFVLTALLALLLAKLFNRPIKSLQKVALELAGGKYETRTNIRGDDEIGSLANSMNILAERLEEARRNDERLQKRQQEFFSNISHELKTPVTVIRGSLEALNDGVVRDEADVKAYYAQMIAESRWLQRLIRDLLELSRLQNLDFSLNDGPVDVRELLGDVAMSASALAERKGVMFVCEEPSENFSFTGDYARLRQMLMAVLDNAVKFTPEGRSVTLSLNGRAISVRDEGCGVPEEELAYIFDRFHHTRDASRESTGLGLAITREIALRHGVKLGVVNNPDRGMTFTFTLPDGGSQT